MANLFLSFYMILVRMRQFFFAILKDTEVMREKEICPNFCNVIDLDFLAQCRAEGNLQ